jgi:hypothetical protein
MDTEFSVEMIDRLVSCAQQGNPIIRPPTADDGRQFYMMPSTRERMIQNLQPGWTYKAVTLTRNDGWCFVLFEPVEIETMAARFGGQTAYFEDSCIPDEEDGANG